MGLSGLCFDLAVIQSAPRGWMDAMSLFNVFVIFCKLCMGPILPLKEPLPVGSDGPDNAEPHSRLDKQNMGSPLI